MASVPKTVAAKASEPPTKQPLIQEKYIDVPSQRLYILSLGFLCQAIKVFDWLHYLVSSTESANFALKWVVVDIIYCIVLTQLRIPRLTYSTAIVLLQIITFCFLDGVMFGGIQIAMNEYHLTTGSRTGSRRDILGRKTGLLDVIGGGYLRGEHTVRMSPISTAKLNPGGQSFCLSLPTNTVIIPVLLNNTKPTHIRYTISSLDSSKVDAFDFSDKDLKAVESSRQEMLQLAKATVAPDSEEDEDDFDAEDVEVEVMEGSLASTSFSNTPHLEKTQSIAHLKVSRTGLIKLDYVYDASSSTDARIFPNEVLIVPCPRAAFVQDSVSRGNDKRCMGTSEDLAIKVVGVPPLSLKWHKEVNGRREYFAVDGVEGSPEKDRQPQELSIPLSVSLDVPGTHQYRLDVLSDGAGNSVSLAPAAPPTRKPGHNQTPHEGCANTDSARCVTVLRRSSISFKGCGPGKPSSLLMGSDAPLLATSLEADSNDGPWEVIVNYQPHPSEKKHKAWRKTIATQPGRRELTIEAPAPGEYTLTDVKGSFCPGDVLSPDSCPVLEQPYPTAEIEWKRIHECSGDTGVSAYLVLHGRPPFQVYYTQRRDNELARETGKTFQGSRGEITLQPESSGNYTYTFVSLSDANYKNIQLNGPSINQVVHPPALANFVGAGGGGGHRSVNSCSGSHIDLDVNLRGKGPWNLEVQIVSPKGLQNTVVSNLGNPRETLHLPIPSLVDEEGGTFQVDLVSIEDAYGCNKSLAVPGVSVNVRRTKPAVKFFAKDGKRSLTVLESETALLPLRLTGDGPWRVRYRRSEPPGSVMTARLETPNEHLRVQDQGVYQLLEVSDLQCPNFIPVDEDTFTVEWVPRPAAKLWHGTDVSYESYNGSYIRQPICEGKEDFVEMELTGRPPFQIHYNVARDSEGGGTKILDQPIMSSVQSRTRFQLHTSEAGRIYYEVKQIGDAAYPLDRNRHHVIPRRERLLFEQVVFGRPTAYFRDSARLSRCLNDAFVPRDAFSTEGTITLEGRPPFLLDISIKNLAASEIHRQTVEIWDAQWKVDLPHYLFKSIGPHLVTIESVQDTSRCDQAISDPLKQSIWVDVAETAAIVPFDRREHFCVGDATQFQLEGIPPWTIGFKSNRKLHEQVVKQSPFSLVQQHPAHFSIVSISHQQDMCKTAVDNINFQVHALPAAQVAQGREVFENIHEGSQAQIVFTLIGEPPFTFTYQRSEPSPRKGAKLGKVLETHTVSGVTSHEYSIYSALEGTWTITFISDRYCRYPPAEPDGFQDR